MSLAILSDERPPWRPASFYYGLWGCTLRFDFPVAKLTDYATRTAELDESSNPFASVVLAHIATQATRRDANARAQQKFLLIRRLYERGFTRQVILDLYRFIDWLLQLPDALDRQVWQQIKTYEEAQHMPYLSTAERIGIAQGLEQGLEQGRAATRMLMVRQAEKRFGSLSDTLTAQMKAVPAEHLDDLALAMLDFTSIDDLQSWLDTHQATDSPHEAID